MSFNWNRAMRNCLLAPLLCLSGPLLSAHEESPSVRYLGNEGLLISAGPTKVLFDAFYSNGFNTYVLVPEDITRPLMAGTEPFDGIDALFVSHVHGDHFSPEPALDFLRRHPQVPVFGSHQVAEALAEVATEQDSALLEQLVIFDILPGEPPVSVTLGELQIDVAAIPHSGGAQMAKVRNLVFRVTLQDQTTVIHMGDATVSDTEFARLQEFFDARTADAAFPPYWFFGTDKGKKIMAERVRAEQTIGVHVPAEALGKGDQWRAQAGGDLFTDPGETRELSHDHPAP